MKTTHQIFLVSDSTGETIDRKLNFLFLNIKSINLHSQEQKTRLMK